MRGWAWGAGLRAAGWGNGLLGRWGRGWRGATGPPARAAAHEHEQAAGREARWATRGGGAEWAALLGCAKGKQDGPGRGVERCFFIYFQSFSLSVLFSN
jgi:hypothetical protein